MVTRSKLNVRRIISIRLSAEWSETDDRGPLIPNTINPALMVLLLGSAQFVLLGQPEYTINELT